MIATFNRFEIEMTMNQANSASHQGRCDEDVEYLLTNRKIQNQLKKISDETLAAELKEYGAWDEEELKNRQDNEQRIIWLAAGEIVDGKNAPYLKNNK